MVDARRPLEAPSSWSLDAIARVALLGVAMLPIGLWAVWPLHDVVDAPVARSVWVLVALSIAANGFVLYYHYTTPPHPKFVMNPRRRWWLRVHVISGLIELGAGLTALALPDPRGPALVMAAAALLGHVPSSFAHNRTVAGAPVVMVPGYCAAIAIHGFCALMLARHPDSQLWLVNTLLLFNTYAWVRVYGFVMMQLELFCESRYTLMVLAGGLTTMTPVLGPLWPLQSALLVTAYALVYRRLFAPDPRDYRNAAREHSRWSGIHEQAAALWATQHQSPAQRARAEAVFTHFAVEGRLHPDALRQLVLPWSLPPESERALFESLGLDVKGLDFDTFWTRLWSIATVREQASLRASVERATNASERARFVFDSLDLDGDGTIAGFELRLLLLEWNLPADESTHYFERCDTDGDGLIGFEEFRRHMGPVWRYLYYDVLHPKVVEGRGLFGRAFAGRPKDPDM